MTITNSIYKAILTNVKRYSFETGGLLGGTNGIVSEFAFDVGTDNSNSGMYYPDVDMLNKCIEQWQENNTQL